MIELASLLGNPWVWLFFMNLIPLTELRATIPAAILIWGLPWLPVFIASVLIHIALAPVIYFCLSKFLDFVLRVDFFNRFYHNEVMKVQAKATPYVEKYGVLGLSLFIFIPLPGSGTYSGTLAAFLLKFGYKKLFIANAVGMFFNGLLWTGISIGAFSFLNGFLPF